MKGFRLFERPVAAFATVPDLEITGELPSYTIGESYEGRLDVLNAIGNYISEIVEEESFLPAGAAVHTDKFNKELVVRWPAYSPPDTVKSSVVNGDFKMGDLTGWHDVRGNGWSVKEYVNEDSEPVPAPPGNQAAWMEGVGRGEWILESDQYDVTPTSPIYARSLWDQGPSNKDNNNLWTAIAFYRNGMFLSEERGDRIHDRTNKRRHYSTLGTVVPAAATHATVRLRAHRRNKRNREIIVDNVETQGFSYSVGTTENISYYITVKATDSAGRVAYWTGPIEPVIPRSGVYWNANARTYQPPLSSVYLSDDSRHMRLESSSATPANAGVHGIISHSVPSSDGIRRFEIQIEDSDYVNNGYLAFGLHEDSLSPVTLAGNNVVYCGIVKQGVAWSVSLYAGGTSTNVVYGNSSVTPTVAAIEINLATGATWILLDNQYIYNNPRDNPGGIFNVKMPAGQYVPWLYKSAFSNVNVLPEEWVAQLNQFGDEFVFTPLPGVLPWSADDVSPLPIVAVWDSAKKGPWMTLLFGGAEVRQENTGYASAIAQLDPKSSGKWQFGVDSVITGGNGNQMMGLVDLTARDAGGTLTTILGAGPTANAVGYAINGYFKNLVSDGVVTGSIISWAAGDSVTGVLDLDAPVPYFRTYVNGVEAQTITLPPGKSWTPAGSTQTFGAIRLRASDLTFPVEGFQDWQAPA